MAQQMEGKVAVVTGAGEGQGRATALLFAAEGARVVAADISGKQEETAAEADGNILPVQCDVSVPEQVEAMIRTAVSQFGRLDVLCNVAGIALGGGMIADDDPDAWDRVQAVNLKGVFLGHQVRGAGDRRLRWRFDPQLGIDRRHHLLGHVARVLGVEGGRHQPHQERGHPVQPTAVCG